MNLEFLKRYEGKTVNLYLKNNTRFYSVVFSITPENLISFQNLEDKTVILEPVLISMISENYDPKVRREAYRKKIESTSTPSKNDKEGKR